MSDYSMADIAGMMGVSNDTVIKNSTSRKGNTELNMEDFLQLMIVQLQNQTIDDTMDTSEMMNQMVQMQMVTAMTNMTETNIMTYASSLVGKVVTVGVVEGNNLIEKEIRVMGTGTYNGQQVIFGHDGQMYQLNQIMAIGYLPNEDGTYGDVTEPDEGEGGADGANGADSSNGTNGTNGADGTNSGNSEGTGGVTGGESAGGAGESQGAQNDGGYDGKQGAPTD